MRNFVRRWHLQQWFAALALLCCLLPGAPGWAQDQTSGTRAESKTEPDQSIQEQKAASEPTDGKKAEQAPEVKNANSYDQDKKASGTSATSATSEKPGQENSGAPVVVAGETVFTISVKLGAYSPERRVASIMRRLSELENEPHFKEKVEQITTKDDEYSTDILAGDATIMTVTSMDARAAGVDSREKLAQDYADKLKVVLKKYIEEHSLKNKLTAVGLTALATVGLFMLLGFTNWLFPRSYRQIVSWQGKHIRELRIQRSRLLSQETLTDILIATLRIIRVLSVLLLLSLYITIVLSFFPETRGVSGDIVNYLTVPLKTVILPALLLYLPNIAFLIVIVFVTYIVLTFTHFLFREVERGNISIDGFDPEWSDSTYKIVRLLIIAFAFVLIFPYLPGSGSPAFQQVSLFMGVLLSLGSTGAMSHVIAGVFLTYTGAFKIGDRVKIADTVGDVMEKTLLATRVRTIKHEYITIPNALVLGSHIINYSSSAGNIGLILHTTVTIGYNSPWKQVEQLLVQAALSTEGVLSNPEPFVLQTTLGDSYVSRRRDHVSTLWCLARRQSDHRSAELSQSVLCRTTFWCGVEQRERWAVIHFKNRALALNRQLVRLRFSGHCLLN
jgi:small-conductance mechanosensitive channel